MYILNHKKLTFQKISDIIIVSNFSRHPDTQSGKQIIGFFLSRHPDTQSRKQIIGFKFKRLCICRAQLVEKPPFDEKVSISTNVE